MLGLGRGELVVILVIALIFLGPKRLPDVATSLGKAIRSFRKATRDLTASFNAGKDKAPHVLFELNVDGDAATALRLVAAASAEGSTSPCPSTSNSRKGAWRPCTSVTRPLVVTTWPPGMDQHPCTFSHQ